MSVPDLTVIHLIDVGLETFQFRQRDIASPRAILVRKSYFV